MTLYIEKTTNLNAGQHRLLLALTASCNRKEMQTISYPLEEEDVLHYLLWSRGPQPGSRKLAGALAILPLDDDVAECVAMIHPFYRRKGFFTRLLKHARRDFAHFDFLFPVPEGAGDVIASLQAAGAEYDHTDLMMEYLTIQCPAVQVLSEPLISESPVPEPSIPEVFLWPAKNPDSIGSCRVIPLSPDCVCLCQVEISPASRGLGHGTAMIRSLLNHLRQCGICRVILHVEKENTPAVALYKKTGFRVIETLSYSLLPSASRADD
ncbi:MAG: GNAT family N-acetyltransferase [Clostridiales bacterium]|nr:GNAT family N-acetyltransferase [Clostridiales bacterium]